MRYKHEFVFRFISLCSQLADISQDHYVTEQSETKEGGPLMMNAFEMITLSQGLNLSVLFDRGQVNESSESISKVLLIETDLF